MSNEEYTKIFSLRTIQVGYCRYLPICNIEHRFPQISPPCADQPLNDRLTSVVAILDSLLQGEITDRQRSLVECPIEILNMALPTPMIDPYIAETDRRLS